MSGAKATSNNSAGSWYRHYPTIRSALRRTDDGQGIKKRKGCREGAATFGFMTRTLPRPKRNFEIMVSETDSVFFQNYS